VVPGGGAVQATALSGERAGIPTNLDATTAEGDGLPATVDLRTEALLGPVKYQGPVGACTAFSFSSTMDNQLRRSKTSGSTAPQHVWSFYGIPQMGLAGDRMLGKTVSALETWPVSHKELCKLTRKPGFDNGGYVDDCIEAYPGVQQGSYESDPALMAKLNAANESAKFKVKSVQKLQVKPAVVEELQSAMASGSALWIAMRIDGSAWSRPPGGVIPDWSRESGGHAITMVGYRDTPKGKQYLIQNSWGESWGEKGFAWVSEKMVNEKMHYAYKVTLEGEAPPPPPPPPAVNPGQNPQPQPPPQQPQAKLVFTDDDCDADELLDIGTGQCGRICPDDSRPFGGKCGVLPNIFGSGKR